MNKNFIIAYVGIIAFYSCKSIQQPIYLATENVRLNNVGIKNSSIKADIKLYNPNTQSLQLKSADIDVFLQNRLLGKIAFDTLLKMPPTDSFYVPVSGNLSMKDILSNVATILFNDSIDIKLQGKIKAGVNGVFKNVAINYEGRQPISRLLNDSTIK